MPHDELARLRRGIDSLDRRIGALLARRFALAREIKLKKLRPGASDPARERAVLANAAAAAGGGRFGAAARAVYGEVLRQAKRLQKC